jgi:hypothetical protein
VAAAVVLLAVGLPVGGCAAEGAAEPTPTTSSGEAVRMPRLRQAGPDSDGHEVVLRFGDRLDVTPADSPSGWVVAHYPSDILRLQGSTAAADRHTFLAIAVGDGRLSLASAARQAQATTHFTLRIRVLRDMIQPPQP